MLVLVVLLLVEGKIQDKGRGQRRGRTDRFMKGVGAKQEIPVECDSGLRDEEAAAVRRRERFLAKLAEIAREYEEPLRGVELVKSRLRWEDWESLSREGLVFARKAIRGRKWRGSRGGTLPGGYDAETVVAQVIEDMLTGKSRLVIGWTRERLVKELERMVRQKVRELHRRKERPLVRSEWEVLSPNALGEPVSVLGRMADGAEGAESQGQRNEVKGAIEQFLKGEPELCGIFECLWLGITRPSEIARRLGIDQREAVRARKRLERKLAGFSRSSRLKDL